MSVTLVTASRSLTDNIEATCWAKSILSNTIAAMVDGDAGVTGDARGGDRWFNDLAAGSWPDVDIFVYHSHDDRGGVITRRGIVVGRWTKQPMPKPGAGHEAWARWHKLRDAVMVGHVARRLPAVCYALIDRRSKTHGTEFTATAAERAGVHVDRFWWPEDKEQVRGQ